MILSVQGKDATESHFVKFGDKLLLPQTQKTIMRWGSCRLRSLEE